MPEETPPGQAKGDRSEWGPNSAHGSRARARFIETLRTTGNVTAAAAAGGIGRTTAYEWYKAEPAFGREWDEAEEVATDALEAEARRRAHDGWDEPVYQSGALVGTVRRYSDRMLEILLKGHRHRFRENQRVEVTGPNGGAVQVQTLSDLVRKANESA